MAGGITVTGDLWMFALRVIFFYVIAAMCLVVLAAVSVRILFRTRPPLDEKPVKLMPPRIIRVE